MKKSKYSFLIAVLFNIVSVSSVLAHSGHEHLDEMDLHVWKNIVTNEKIKGDFLSFNQNTIYLENSQGKVISIPLNQLSKEDYSFVKTKIAKIERINHQHESLTEETINKSVPPFLLISLLIILCGLLISYLATKLKLKYFIATITPITICVACESSISREGNINTTQTKLPNISVTTSPSSQNTQANESLQTNLSDNLSSLKIAFEPFKNTVKTRNDDNYFYIESNGIPEHEIMVGITSWQQQVPLPQNYYGDNAWSIPLKPVLADNPISTKNNFYRGAIAVAVNGIPIFNALNNRGEDALAFGELDKWGGHCGRADDYHYHIAPMHLAEIVGKNKPLGYALDGFAIYGEKEPDGSEMKTLDENNGHFDGKGGYHYHGTNTYPYTIGRMRGIVKSDGEQIIPQARTTPIRDFLQPLKGAVISGFKSTGEKAYSLEYTLNNAKYYVNYQWDSQDIKFEFVDKDGNKAYKTYKGNK